MAVFTPECSGTAVWLVYASALIQDFNPYFVAQEDTEAFHGRTGCDQRYFS